MKAKPKTSFFEPSFVLHRNAESAASQADEPGDCCAQQYLLQSAGKLKEASQMASHLSYECNISSSHGRICLLFSFLPFPNATLSHIITTNPCSPRRPPASLSFDWADRCCTMSREACWSRIKRCTFHPSPAVGSERVRLWSSNQNDSERVGFGAKVLFWMIYKWPSGALLEWTELWCQGIRLVISQFGIKGLPFFGGE